NRRKIPRPGIQPHPAQLRAQSGALQIGVCSQVNIAAKHPRADQRKLDRSAHGAWGIQWFFWTTPNHALKLFSSGRPKVESIPNTWSLLAARASSLAAASLRPDQYP